MTLDDVSSPTHRWRVLLEERHGAGAYDRLMADLRQPCVTFAAIAKRLGVTRERVRQWQLALLPDAPRGHARQRLCALHRQKRRLLEEPLFRTFYRHARAELAPGRIELIKASDGYRKRSVRVDRRVIVLREARRLTGDAEALAPAYALAKARGPADFVYYRLTAEEYLLMPAFEVPASGVQFVDGPGLPFQEFKNTFGALRFDAERQTA